MRKHKTRYEKLKQQLSKAQSQVWALEREKEEKQTELSNYCRRHRSLSYDNLSTCDIIKLKKIYLYFDMRYPIEWQGGFRLDDRGMALYFWVNDDPDCLELHLSSTCENLCFSGSTSWLVPAKTLEDKIAILKKIKNDISEILKGE